jgi:enoyl-CoA hydratase
MFRRNLTRRRATKGHDLDCLTVAGENEDVLVTVENGVGRLVLNRPKAINSLTHSMVTVIASALTAWEHDDTVHTVLLTGAGDRGLCAGGDVVAIYHSAQADGAEARRFWYDEYLLNAQIGSYPKPYVAVMDGIVMGGGVGVSAHAGVRVVTDTTKMAMPEVGIGLIPDVGGTYRLARTPGLLGIHAALSGAPFNGADAIALGFADHFVPHDRLADFTQAIVEDGVDAALAAHAQQPPASALLAHRDWVDACYAGHTAADIVDALRAHPAVEANTAADLIAGRSPIAVSVALEAVRRAADLSLTEALQMEYRTSCAAVRSHDLVEGIRAQIIDKDRNPTWDPASLAVITAADVEGYFAPADPDLVFDEQELP